MRENNFDVLRLFLAFSVVWHHFLFLTGSERSFFIFDLINSNVAVKSFFVVSGLLIWVSANNTNKIMTYAVKRFFRLYPALLLVLITMSVVSLMVYDQSFSEVFRYFLWNSIFLNFIHPCIGDVFENNRMCAVNGALWTLKLEVSYYFFIGFTVFFLKKYAYKLVILISIISFFMEVGLSFLSSLFEPYSQTLLNQIPFKFYYFGLGVIVYHYKDYISTYVLLIVFSVGFIGVYAFNVDLFFTPIFVVSFVFLMAYRAPLINISKVGDLSYGMYIYHFPLAQVFLYSDWLSEYFYLNFFIFIFILLVLSRMSWFFIEKKSISYGNKFLMK
jgi:peptidoglycan/LPS O-acetylase OafA/YrhL